MIDCLSNPSWINPQIDFLLFLQNIRIEHSVIFDKFFLSITVFGELWLPTLVCAIVYWCIDFKSGLYLFSLECFNSIITHFLKMIACVYRPWVLSDKIHPSELAVPFAKGYSFPSGHSSMSSAVLGGLAYLIRQKKIFCISLICLVLLIGFSRLWLGVHTPQDVVCGLLVGFSSIFIVDKIIKWAEKNKNRYLILALIANIITAAMIIYMQYFNNYRMDYIDGKLLVDPQKSIYSTVLIYGYILGLLNGYLLCAKFFPFNPQKTTVKNRVIIGITGSLLIIFISRNIIEHFIMNSASITAVFPIMFIIGLFITLIYPLIFQYFDKNIKE